MPNLNFYSKSIAIVLLSASATLAHAAVPQWFERDSLEAVNARILRDFPRPASELNEMFPSLTRAQIDDAVAMRQIETLMVGDTLRVHRKAPGNFKLLSDKTWGGRGSTAKPSRIAIVDSIVSASRGEGELVNKRTVTYRFSIDVPTCDFLEGDTLSVWMPLPMQTVRQPRVTVIDASPAQYVISTPTRSPHNTIFMRQAVADSVTHFEYTARYEVGAQYFSPEYILKNLKPYDTSSDVYKKYTAMSAPHIVDLKDEAKKIVGNETNPFKCSELVYDHIIKNYPWAGAREYSTIDCIPTYVINEGHGDCGQVSLLYVSMMRSLGIPARWESGWMLHPGEKNLHDWAEVYFEGVGWVPVDSSFGRYTPAENEAVRKFYSTGQDSWRLAANLDVSRPFFPPKKFIRSETVDSQMGEVETTKGNLFYPGWDQTLEIISVE